MGSLVRYLPSAAYTRMSVAIAGIAIASLFASRFWLPALGPALAGALLALGLIYLVLRPPIEVHDAHIQIGRRLIAWDSVSHVDAPYSIAPLILPLTLNSKRRYWLIYIGSRDSGRTLLHQIRRHSRFALIDGLPYGQFWEEDLEAFRERCVATDPLWNVILPADEEDVERMFLALRREDSPHPRRSDESLL